ncbi:Pkinase-domain-containing protein [Fomitiporia mediterranea MF3/22]|uniref:Pkinase-domain-containing protein n=1 Tax=Fomitiporia mediterranea (strain MF3/22) TaxID=694068 RepID=UPI000440939D|nr:Pkinase-domain-containing protein [Fomitiporia mediterranea MF3/22]EJC98130.1 Pkinase-domain-containing protein [Fomitiporia mediterranea MF3/22]
MTTPIVRKKRNFKALQLDVSKSVQPAPTPPPPVQNPEPVATRAPPQANGRKRPPPMKLAAPKVSATASPAEDNLLTVNGDKSTSAPTTGTVSATRPYHNDLTQKLANLDMNAETKYDLRNEDLKELQELGQGNGGSVKKVEHIPTGKIMAKKIVLIDAKPSVRKQILRELQIMHDCHSGYIISFYGAFLSDPNVCMCIEFMDKGSLDGIYKRIGAIDIDVVGRVALAVLEGLTYLYDVHRIIHRDIKPSNILCNSSGQIKICDFGVSGELINSIADTFVGTSTYMSPERIQGAQYTVKSDVWSLGISLIELALGRFPFSEDDASDSDLSDLEDLEGTLSPQRPGSLLGLPLPSSRKKDKNEKTSKKDKRKSKGVSLQGGGMTMSILELLQHIVNEPAPRLTPEGRFPKEAENFVDSCLLKDPDDRLTPKDLLNHPWIVQSRSSSVDLEAWANSF